MNVYVIMIGGNTGMGPGYVHAVRNTAEDAVAYALEIQAFYGDEEELRRTGASGSCSIEIWETTGSNTLTYDSIVYDARVDWTPLI